jgi:hypothetical protein
MEKNAITQFQDGDQVSGEILYRWLNACGVTRRTVLEEINQSDSLNENIGPKTFQQWTSMGDSAKKISAMTVKEYGNRVVAIVRWFFNEHLHRLTRIITCDDLIKIIGIYEDIPIKNRLQLKRILHDLEIANGEREAKLPTSHDWKKQLCAEPLCAFVVDRYWCLRATTHYELAFAGYEENDVKNWGCWHRLTASMRGVPKHVQGSPMSQTRGIYAKEYYIKQMTRFRLSINDLLQSEDERLVNLMDLLNETPEFCDYWNTSVKDEEEHLSSSIGFPVPFFRRDGTLLWMMELSTVISNTDGYRLIIWTPTDHDSNMYLADLIKSVDESNDFSKRCYFVENYADFFTEKQKIALGLNKNPD